jgi:hypothetical protein
VPAATEAAPRQFAVLAPTRRRRPGRSRMGQDSATGCSCGCACSVRIRQCFEHVPGCDSRIVAATQPGRAVACLDRADNGGHLTVGGATYRNDFVLPSPVSQQLAQARKLLNAHAADVNGVCIRCRVARPCPHQESAVKLVSLFRDAFPRAPISHRRDCGPRSTGCELRRNCRRSYDERKATVRHAA